MRVVVHDYAGHPFEVQLSRELARRGHVVLHLHCGSLRGGKGAIERTDEDPVGFDVQSVALAREFDKYSLWRRPLDERSYARRLIRPVLAFNPDVVVSANTPLISQRMLLSECKKHRIPFVFWHQDILSIGIKNAVRNRIGSVIRPVTNYFSALEQSLLKHSDAVVTISEDFLPVLDEWGISRANVKVIPNWAPLDELPVLPRTNRWAIEHGLDVRRVILYAGTLGLKHDPGLLLETALRLQDHEDVRVVAVAGGVGAEQLRSRTAQEAARNLIVMPPQPYERLAEVLASGDVLVAMLESDAGVFSVPSKVLTYLCAARPVLAAMPAENLAARILRTTRSGLVVAPGDSATFSRVAATLLERPALRTQLGRRARAYAEAAFDVRGITDEFEEILSRLAVL